MKQLHTEPCYTSIPKLLKDISLAKLQFKKEFDDIKYVKNPKALKLTEPSELKLPPILSKDETYNEMKLQYKQAWKNPGYRNQEFSMISVLKGKLLTPWDHLKVQMTEKSYKYPQGYKGFKNNYFGDYFGEPQLKLYPRSFQAHLITTQNKFNEYLMRPSRFGTVETDTRIEKIKKFNKEPFKLVNSAQSKNFGFGKHETWEFEIRLNKLDRKSKRNSY